MSLLKQSASVFLTRISMLVLGIVSSIVVNRLLGPTYRGMLEILSTLPFLIVNLGSFGIGNANLYFTGKKTYPIEKIVSNSLSVVLILSGMLLAVAFAIVLIFRQSLFQSIPPLYIVIAFSIIPMLLLEKNVQYTLLGKQDIYRRNFLILLQGLTNFFGIMCLVWLFDLGIVGVLIASLLSYLIASTMNLQSLANLASLSLSFDYKMTLRFIQFGLIPFLALAIMNLNYRLDVFLIKYFLTDAELGYYGVGVSLSEKIWMIPQSIGLVLFSVVSNSTEKKANLVTPQVCRIVLFLSAAAGLILYFFIPILLPLMYGKAYNPAIVPFRMILPGIVMMTVYLILYGDLAGRGKNWYGLMVSGSGLILNIAMNLALIPLMGIKGAALSSTISYSSSAILIAVIFSRKYSIPLTSLLVITSSDVRIIRDRMVHGTRKNA